MDCVATRRQLLPQFGADYAAAPISWIDRNADVHCAVISGQLSVVGFGFWSFVFGLCSLVFKSSYLGSSILRQRSKYPGLNTRDKNTKDREYSDTFVGSSISAKDPRPKNYRLLRLTNSAVLIRRGRRPSLSPASISTCLTSR